MAKVRRTGAFEAGRAAVRTRAETLGVATELGRGGRGIATPLSTGQRVRLRALEETIDAGMKTVIDVASALATIREERLYRESHATFEAYVAERFGIARRTAYGYIEGAKVIPNVPAGLELSLSHLRLLAPLPPNEQRELASAITEQTVADARRTIREWRRARRAAHAELPSPPPLPAGTYRTICADPPWHFDGNDRGDGLAADQFPTMTSNEIAALPVPDLAGQASHLYLWAPAAKVPEAASVCEAWGFRYVGLLTWVKPGLGLGRYFRTATEHVVFGVRGRLMTRPNLCNYFEAPRGRHSEKPAEFYRLVEQASPGPYLELFARRPRTGWTVWGNEV